jgi:hypothetical protein
MPLPFLVILAKLAKACRLPYLQFIHQKKKNTMKYIYVFLILSIFVSNGCENNTSDELSTETTFDFKIKGSLSGHIASDAFGEANIKCGANRIIISFERPIPPNIEDDSNLLFGEIILAFLLSDSLGTFPLNEITTRVEEQVGFAALLNPLHFDDLSAQYISNEQRFQNVKNGNLVIKKWSRIPNERIEGTLEVTLIDDNEDLLIKGNFSILVSEANSFCLQ